MSMPSTSRWSLVFTPTAMMTETEANLQVGGIDPQIRKGDTPMPIRPSDSVRL